jgi:hypothetical protein
MKSERQIVTIARLASVLLATLTAALWTQLGSAQETPAAPIPVETSAAPTAPVAPAAPKLPAAPPRFGLQAYDVEIAVTFGVDPSLSAEFRSGVLARMRDEIAGRAGEYWNPVAIAEAKGDLKLGQIGPDRSHLERLAPALKSHPSDKVFIVAIDHQGGEFSLRAAEWDRNSATFGVWIEETTTDRRLVPSLATKLVGSCFRPLAIIETVEEGAAILELRAGELTPPDDRFLPIRIGDSLQPYVRHLNRKRELDRIQPIPWTYLTVDEIDRSRAVCRVVSSFKTPLTINRRRAELMAVGATPVFEETELVITPHQTPNSPVIGARVELLDRLPTKEDKVEDRVITATDRLGRVKVPVDPLKPIVWVFLYSGKSLLARVPLAPGLVPRLSLTVPDDGPRLTVEGEISLLEGEIIDVVGRREVFMARARQLVKQDKWDEIDRLMERIDELPSIADFERRAETVRVSGVQLAKDRRDRVAEARIEKLVSSFMSLVREHLDPEKISGFKDEMAELKRAK